MTRVWILLLFSVLPKFVPAQWGGWQEIPLIIHSDTLIIPAGIHMTGGQGPGKITFASTDFSSLGSFRNHIYGSWKRKGLGLAFRLNRLGSDLWNRSRWELGGGHTLASGGVGLSVGGYFLAVDGQVYRSSLYASLTGFYRLYPDLITELVITEIPLGRKIGSYLSTPHVLWTIWYRPVPRLLLGMGWNSGSGLRSHTVLSAALALKASFLAGLEFNFLTQRQGIFCQLQTQVFLWRAKVCFQDGWGWSQQAAAGLYSW